MIDLFLSTTLLSTFIFCNPLPYVHTPFMNDDNRQMHHAIVGEHSDTKGFLRDSLSLPSRFRIVWCGLQCRAPMAFPAQLFHRPWRTQVAVMTEDARLVALHSLDTMAPTVAPSPARPLRKARIWRPDIWSVKIFLNSFSKFKKMRRNKNHCRQANYTVDICFIAMIYRQGILRLSWRGMDTAVQIVKEPWASS